ncbi:release factor glutamine methyltransferase [Arthrobacter sp. Hiyo4]|nr:release factor glutamine methyltransferase [Arthrobacter sp. Hiyo4]
MLGAHQFVEGVRMSATEFHVESLLGIAERLRSAGCVFAEEEARLLLAAVSGPAEIAAAVEQRVAGYPLEHILGWAEFCGLRIELDAGVFVPRRRTGLLVNEAAALLSADAKREHLGGAEQPVVVDLCCGSGAVGLPSPSGFRGWSSMRRTLTRLRWPAPAGTLAVWVVRSTRATCLRRCRPPSGADQCNGCQRPYVPTGAIESMPHEAREHEPLWSLDGGTDGLEFHRRVAAEATEWLRPGGNLIIETSERQAGGTSSILAHAGFAVRTVRSEELDGTAVVGRARP